ncbi:hypothetical protein D3C81_1627600 [compost metagenome]
MLGLSRKAQLLAARTYSYHLGIRDGAVALEQCLGISGSITIVHLPDNPLYRTICKHNRTPLGKVRCSSSKLMNRSNLHLGA